MPTATTTKETWRDWFPDAPEPDELFTRDEIAQMASGIWAISGDDIRYWEYQGVLPRSIRQKHDGTVRAVYPRWYSHLAARVRQLQRMGLSLEEIRQQIREQAGNITLLGMDVVVEPLAIPPEVEASMNAFAHHLAKQGGAAVRSIDVSIVLADGGAIEFLIPVTEQ